MLEIKNLHVKLQDEDKAILKGLDLTVPAGSFYGLVGPNGAGKTTTLSMATGLLRPDAGSVHVQGFDLWRDPDNVELFALRYAAGAGLRITTPIGPLALDYGINLIRRSWEDFGAVHFSSGLF